MRRLAARLPSLGDAGIAAGFLAIMLVELTFDFGARGPRSGGVAMAVVMAVALAFRRRWPVSSYMVGTAALAAQALLFFIGTLYPYANLAHLYSVGAFATRRRAVAGLLIGFCGIAAYFSVTDFGFPPLPVVVAAIWFLAWAAGFGVARSREAAEAEQQEQARQSAAAERSRIAREIHDLVGHSINVMVVQAGAGRRILDSDAERARDALIAIEETGR
ncbi:MAG TPA: histidine kinase dimerization/phosphoacceptor domain-containing protein, partial [Egibacteraceae bacterium]|nr:histidine kinase dimerization/phosphoacceptor domain-containing protein [Egibacteraceae bacterium]